MQERMISSRISYVSLVCALLLVALLEGFYAQNAAASPASHVSPHFVSIKPDHIFVSNTEASTYKCQAATAPLHCYGPAQIRNAYSIQPLLNKGITGKGTTIVILDAYGAPSIASDLHTFDQNFGLNDPILNVIPGQGSLPTFDPKDPLDQGWAGEIALDVEWSHVVAPDATIDLVIANTSNDDDLVASLNYAISQNLGDTISMSFGEDENCEDAPTAAAWHSAFTAATRKGITLFASAGDEGAAQVTCDGNSYEQVASSPADDPLVTGVGGTQLVADLTTGAYQSETTWNEPKYNAGGGGGYSKLYSKPFYQYGNKNIPGNGRGVPDVAYNAAINGGVLTVTSDSGYGPGAILISGGTSSGSPQWAGIAALANQLGHKRLGLINPYLYLAFGLSKPLYASTFHDITVGTNGITLPDAKGNLLTFTGYNAQKGWDATTGWGSPIVSKFVPLITLLTVGNRYSRQINSMK
jgi:subtilase family serine protease